VVPYTEGSYRVSDRCIHKDHSAVEFSDDCNDLPFRERRVPARSDILRKPGGVMWRVRSFVPYRQSRLHPVHTVPQKSIFKTNVLMYSACGCVLRTAR